jgi:hypothetical protein
MAYHPKRNTLDPIDVFSHMVHLKRVGGQQIYSYKEKLPQEDVDMFYAWFEKAFRKKLRRPKGPGPAMSTEVAG